jgi:hypothetical protein
MIASKLKEVGAGVVPQGKSTVKVPSAFNRTLLMPAKGGLEDPNAKALD